MPSDLSAFARMKEATNMARKCWFQRLTDEQKQTVNDARSNGFSIYVIARVVEEEWGVVAKRSTVASHFRGACSCE